MQTKRTYFLVALAFLLIVAMLSGSYAGANTLSYENIASGANWDAQIDKAIAQRRAVVSALSYESVEIAPKAFQTIYELGPEAVPYVLDRIEKSGGNGGDEAFLVGAVSFVLQDTLHYKTKDNPHMGGTPQYHAYNLRAFLKAAPELAEEICNSDATDAEKLEKLSELGLAALPYITARIQRGETQWVPYLETQLLGLSAEERFEALKTQATQQRAGLITSIYAYRQRAAKPVDVDQWIAANKDTLSVLEEVTG